ncbi:MAG: glycoside hydrolase/phage tail family protein [Roseovarius sp.]|nr:glycoside hydrolase/phage tail family protein [Roseovarius sp.]
MATILLSAAGAAIGGTMGGTVLGLSSAVAGRFAGAVIGRSIDQRLLGQGSDVVETGRADRLRLTGAGEGDPVARVYGRMRVAGQIIWATEFREEVTVRGGSGKGGRSAEPERREITYSLSLGVALCEGEITHVGRVWADGTEIARDSLTMQVYRGTADQTPDPKMEAVEGAGQVPAYRGTAYVVIEDLGLGRFGNRVPQLTFEVCRPAQPDQAGAEMDPAHAVTGVAMLPGSGEYTLATTPVTMDFGPGSGRFANVNSPSGKADFTTSVESLLGELPRCRGTSLIVSWFGDDLRCDQATIRPKPEQQEFESANMPWEVSGVTRQSAQPVAQDAEGRPVYGGTPADAAVIEAILGLQQAGQDVMVYPFILMEQMRGNGLPDPWSDAEDQPVLPWRGRITTSVAPGRPASPDGTAAAVAEVTAFFGTARATDFSIVPVDAVEPDETEESDALSLLSYGGVTKRSPVSYHGPEEWSYRRFILHQAALCAAAGGVESFCIGSEMRSLTQIRGPANSFPAVDQLIDLAAEVRTILGPEVKISYAADWSEYFGYKPGNGDRFFHLDPLWADANIDFIGIDNYMPLSDWRDGPKHADSRWGEIYELGYLQSNIEGGEGYDWYYPTPEARAAQRREPITDVAHGEPWIWRYKDIRNWWRHAHHDRVNGERQGTPTPWVPQSKPVRFTEYGCAAIDKGTNQPNKFLDPKSSESRLPHHSSGQRDELIQLQYLRAMAGYWRDPAKNPVSEEYGGPMIDMEHAHVWAWDARPYPFFPLNRQLWTDAENYARGHWITGRASGRTLASVIDEITARAGLAARDTARLHGYMRGYLVEEVGEARNTLQPLSLRYAFDAVDRDGFLRFVPRGGEEHRRLDPDHLVRHPELDGTVEQSRGNPADLAGRVRLRFVEADGDFEVIAEEAILPDDETHAVSTSEMPLAMTRAEGRQTVERWLSESRIATDGVQLVLPPSMLDLGAGDVVALPETGGDGLYRVDRSEQMGNAQKLEAVRVEPESYRPILVDEVPAPLRAFAAPTPISALFLDLPLLSGDEVPHAPHLAVMADPWPGTAALYASDSDAAYKLNTLLAARSPVGVTQTPLFPAPAGRIDRGAGLFVKMLFGQLESIEQSAFLAGGNLCAIGDGTPDNWEVFQFRDAELVETGTYVLRNRLRGQQGTETQQRDPWPPGSYIVRLDGSPMQIGMADAQRGQARHYRIGPADRPVDDPAYQHAVLAFDGIGLRPYAPAHLRMDQQSGARHYSWVRRTRIGGDRWDTPEVPLGEETERYLVRVTNEGEVLREVMVPGPEWTYSAQAQAADGLTGPFELRVAQVSAAFGPGSFAVLEQTV